MTRSPFHIARIPQDLKPDWTTDRLETGQVKTRPPARFPEIAQVLASSPSDCTRTAAVRPPRAAMPPKWGWPGVRFGETGWKPIGRMGC